MYLLGIDIGTTGVKAIVFNPRGEALSYGFREYSVDSSPDGGKTQDGEKVFSIAKSVIKEACIGLGDKLSALSLSVQGDAVCAVDSSCRCLSPFILGMDYRSKNEAQALASHFGEAELFAKTGMRPHPMNSICKISWLLNNYPLLKEQAHKFVTYGDFFLKRLGSEEFVIDYSMAGRTMAFELKSQSWSPQILSFIGISPDKLSQPVPCASVVGTVDAALAKELSLNPQTKIVTGGHDQVCAALGSGASTDGIALDSHGTAEVVSTVLGSAKTDESMYNSYYPCYPYAVGGQYFTFSLNHTAGLIYKWFVEEFCRADSGTEEKNTYEEILSNAAPQPTGLLILPYLNGSGTPDCDIMAKGLIAGLTLDTTRYDIAKALHEALAFEVKRNLLSLQQAGVLIKELRCAGGGARSKIGLQLKADVLGIPVSTLKIREAACLGAAICAGLATGIFTNTAEAGSIIKTDTSYFPRQNYSKVYEEKYNSYLQLYRVNKDLLHTL